MCVLRPLGAVRPMHYAFPVKVFPGFCISLVLIFDFGYYVQAIRGEYQILAHRKSIDKLIADPKTDSKLRQQLQLVQRLRAFAKTELKLPVDGSYAKYVALHRR